MYKIAALGNFERVAYFGEIGVEVFVVSSTEEAEKLMKKLAKNGYAVIFTDEEYYSNIFENDFLPAVLPLSFGGGTQNEERISGYIKRAIGSDMIFEG